MTQIRFGGCDLSPDRGTPAALSVTDAGLTTIATDTAGNVQRDYQYVGGPAELQRDDDPSDSALGD